MPKPLDRSLFRARGRIEVVGLTAIIIAIIPILLFRLSQLNLCIIPAVNGGILTVETYQSEDPI